MAADPTGSRPGSDRPPGVLLAPLALALLAVALATSAEARTTGFVDIRSDGFHPATVEVYQGETVEWTNQDTVQHTVTSKSGTLLQSPPLGNGYVYTRTFVEPGTYAYRCAYHPAMEGTVVVRAAPMPPVAAFNLTVSYLTVTVDASASTYSPSSTDPTYTWDWGDGSPSGTGVTASHTYGAAGTFPILLTLTDGHGKHAAAERNATVTNATIAGGGFTVVVSGLTVQVAAVFPEEDGSYRPDWSFGDGTLIPDTVATTHPYASAGTYTIALTLTDEDTGATRTFTQDVTLNRPPEAAFTATLTGRAVTVNASASSDPDGPLVEYRWTWGDGSTNESTGPLETHVYATSGPFTVTLLVRDAHGATATVSSTVVANLAPVGVFTTAVTGLSLAVDAGASLDPDGSSLAYRWDWGDGSAPGSGAAAAHTFAAAGTYPVTLTLTDAQGESVNLTRQVTVAAAPTGSTTDEKGTPGAGLLAALAATGVAVLMRRRTE